MNPEGIYNEVFVGSLFDRMAKTYGVVNYLSSFGFTERWRRQCIEAIRWDGTNIQTVYDLMSGMGECWGLILQKNAGDMRLIGVDISVEMNKRALHRLEKHPRWPIEVRQENVLQNDLEASSADVVISTFGLKTFSEAQLERLADEVARILKPGGQFSMIEVSRPPWLPLRVLFLFYLNRIIPIIGALFMGDTDTYKMLGKYCAYFDNCRVFKEMLERRGLEVVTRVQYKVVSLVGTDDVALTTEHFSLYPNPAQRAVTLRWKLLEAADVRIVVSDVAGRQLHTLLDERVSAGPQVTLHSLPQMQSGLHFVQLLTNGTLQWTAKLLIL